MDAGQDVGLASKVISTLLQRTGIEAERIVVPWRRALLLSQKASNSCVYPLQRSQEREAYFRWVSPILATSSGLYGLQGSQVELSHLSDAQDYRVGALAGSSTEQYLKSAGLIVDAGGSEAANYKKLSIGRFDLWATDDLSAAYLPNVSGGEALVPQLSFFTSMRALGCSASSSPEVVRALQRELEAMYQDGTMAALRDDFLNRLHGK
ncbi:ABC transporter substrate-binding protein [Aestuariirhabdus sp. Z084]|nr:ABC transporter substrate-binding protein [Aestuariirhabdus haliotis]MCL6420005.1 ABC transporter substrate-binding protein [Aestuariirhabdus haliotis]